ncbi:FAD binding domain-containing protein [Apiospora sp. TS-2023a]
MVESLNTSIIILGGSIVGLCNALFLAQRGVPCVLIERHAGSSPHPRAMGWTHRTMELFRTVDGLEAELKAFPSRAGGKPRRVTTKTLNDKWDDESHWTNSKPGAGPRGGAPAAGKGPAPADFSSATPVGALGIAQDKLEPILRAKAIALGADLRLGYKMTDWSLNDDDNNVSLTATNSATGNTLYIKGSYLVACDGANSRIRTDLGIATSGVGHLRTMYSTLFRCPSIEHHLASGVSQWSIQNDDLEAFLVTYQEGRWALMTSNPAHESLDDDERKGLIRQAIGGGGEVEVEILARGTWALRGAIADAFADKSNRVFLAGDAAHALPPNRGGYGANTGVADAHNLAWKLDAVLAGRADKALLETYDAERRPVALVRHDQIFAREDYRQYVADSAWLAERKQSGKGGIEVLDDVAMELGQVYHSGAVMMNGDDDEGKQGLAKTPAESRGQPGFRAPHIWLNKGDATVSSLDLLCGGWVVLSKDPSWKGRLGEVKSAECVIVGHDVEEADQGAFEVAFGVGNTGAILIRPDGYVGARWKDSTALGDVKQVHMLVGYTSC